MFICPNCGEPVQNDRAQACPHCGSDNETGWNPDADYLSVELPEEEDVNENHTGEFAPNISTPFAVFVVILIFLGIIAFFGSYSLSNPFLFIGALVTAVAVIFYCKKHRR